MEYVDNLWKMNILYAFSQLDMFRSGALMYVLSRNTKISVLGHLIRVTRINARAYSTGLGHPIQVTRINARASNTSDTYQC